MTTTLCVERTASQLLMNIFPTFAFPFDLPSFQAVRQFHGENVE